MSGLLQSPIVIDSDDDVIVVSDSSPDCNKDTRSGLPKGAVSKLQAGADDLVTKLDNAMALADNRPTSGANGAVGSPGPLSPRGGRHGAKVAARLSGTKRKAWGDEEKKVVADYLQQAARDGSLPKTKEALKVMAGLVSRTTEAVRGCFKRDPSLEDLLEAAKAARPGPSGKNKRKRSRAELRLRDGALVRACRTRGVACDSQAGMKQYAVAFQCECGGVLRVLKSKEEWAKDAFFIGCRQYHNKEVNCCNTYTMLDLDTAVQAVV